MTHRLSAGLILFMLTPSAFAVQKRGSLLSASVSYSEYNDLQMSSSTAAEVIDPSIDIEVGIRLKSLFQFIVTHSISTEDTRTATGAGFRVDTPGFLWFGTGSRQHRYGQKNYPVNTSLFTYLFQAQVGPEDSSDTETTNGSTSGLTIDLFLFNQYVYLSLQGAITNQQGNVFTSHSAGLGVEF